MPDTKGESLSAHGKGAAHKQRCPQSAEPGIPCPWCKGGVTHRYYDIPRKDGCFSYLSTILDAYTKQILAYTVSASLEVDFVLETIYKLVENHGVSLQNETLIHSDQGCHYTSYKFIQLVKDVELRQSMSRKANYWDNAPQESLYGHMKDEIDLSGCQTHAQVSALIDDWVDYYNNDRYQWDLARLSTNEYCEYIRSGQYPLPTVPPDELC
jgi:transposase InsO family protein